MLINNMTRHKHCQLSDHQLLNVSDCINDSTHLSLNSCHLLNNVFCTFLLFAHVIMTGRKQYAYNGFLQALHLLATYQGLMISGDLKDLLKILVVATLTCICLSFIISKTFCFGMLSHTLDVIENALTVLVIAIQMECKVNNRVRQGLFIRDCFLSFL